MSFHKEAHCHACLLDVECSKGLLWNKQFSVFLEALPDWEKLKHIVVFPLGLHAMPRLKKVEKRGKPIFYFLSPLLEAELKVDPSLRVQFPPSPNLPNISARVSYFPGSHRGLEHRNGKQGMWSLLPCFREERSLFLSSSLKAGQKVSVAFQRNSSLLSGQPLRLSW